MMPVHKEDIQVFVYSYNNPSFQAYKKAFIKTHGSESRSQERAKRLPKQNAPRTTVCLLQEQTFSSFDFIITVNISRAASTFKPTLYAQKILTNINQHPKDKSNQLSSLLFPAWSKSMNFVFTFFFFDGSSQFSFLNCHICLKLALLLGLL